jgi:aryl-alcohol dehydrogenase-like predicted oxidoreductase
METKRLLGRTGLTVGRLGLTTTYGAPAQAVEEAFDRGCNYYWWGSQGGGGMAQALRNLVGRGRRENLVVVLQSYARFPWWLERTVLGYLKTGGLDYADGLVLAWHRNPPSGRLLDKALDLKYRGVVRFLGVSSHDRKLFPAMNSAGLFDFFHIRYNAAHRGAETETFPHLGASGRPGVVTYTATRWGQLLDPRRMPPGEAPLTASDCYRFVLSHPSVDVCMAGPSNLEQTRAALGVLDAPPLTRVEKQRMTRIGDYVRSRSRFFNWS